ncbi:MAG TPA: radical SAM family heme chaperone HemW, partial [Microthrixaceae bacterium]|nr:radical SAM family heme chaperone HemW [Microthrixaceae bacterium]
QCETPLVRTPPVTGRPWSLAAADEVAATPLGLYIHVPFCERRCGYCAFNTYTASDLPGNSRRNYVEAAIAETILAASVIGEATGSARPALETVYLGGGTPTVLSVDEIGRILASVKASFETRDGIEITIEANPDGLDLEYLRGLRQLGINRISFGMQSTSRRVLNLLDRTHDPLLALRAVDDAHEAGFEHVSLDLIYGTPGELLADFNASLNSAIATGVDHISAYALGIESGTKLAARVRSGALPRPSDDEAAERYTLADDTLSAAGFSWYELSNWALTPESRSQHNLLYWANANWWGIGPGAHSHLSGVRWWNKNHPSVWADPLLGSSDGSHVGGYEHLDAEQRRLEHVMLGIRLASGLAVDDSLDRSAIDRLVDQGLITVVHGLGDVGSNIRGQAPFGAGNSCPNNLDRLVLTRQGRLLADHVVGKLT